MKLRTINEVIVASPGMVQSKLRSILGRDEGKEVDYKNLHKHIDKTALFIDDPKGDLIIIGDEDRLKDFKIPPSANGHEILPVRELIKRLDPKTFKDNTPPKMVVLK